MTKRIPNNPETTLDKLRLLRREWVKEKVRSDKEMVKVYDMLNELIKELKSQIQNRGLPVDNGGREYSKSDGVERHTLNSEKDKLIEQIIDREKRMQCLRCGVSLQREILDKRIHIHLCKNCRLKELDKLKETAQ